jgi:hypothetical protein
MARAWSSREGFAWDSTRDVSEQVWTDGQRTRWRGPAGDFLVDGERWWGAWADADFVAHYDGTGDPMLLGSPFTASMVMPDLIERDDEVGLRVVRVDEWIGRPCIVVDVTSATRESGTLPATLATYDSEGCWVCDRYECWLDLEHAFVLRFRAYKGSSLHVERALQELEIDPVIDDAIFTFEIQPGTRVIDAGHTPPPWR